MDLRSWGSNSFAVTRGVRSEGGIARHRGRFPPAPAIARVITGRAIAALRRIADPAADAALVALRAELGEDWVPHPR
jgi:hypothetical protein